jgi:hypothetical protein
VTHKVVQPMLARVPPSPHQLLLPQLMPQRTTRPVLNQLQNRCLLLSPAGVSDVQGVASPAYLSATSPASLLMLLLLLFLLAVMPAGVTDGAHTGRYSTTPLLLQPMPQHTTRPALSQLHGRCLLSCLQVSVTRRVVHRLPTSAPPTLPHC